jgi:hypothetical protein
MSNVKNYKEQGGDKWVISGILEVTADGQIIIEGIELKRAAAQADSVAATVAGLKDDFNSLLAKLRTAGIIAEE